MSERTKLSEQIEREVVATPEVAKSEATRSAGLANQIEKSRGKGKSYLMDLRIHSPASLGYISVAGIDAAPAMVRLAKVKGLDLIAVTDFYTGEFIDRVVEPANEAGLTVIPGTAIRCKLGVCDDLVLTCLFPESFRSSDIQSFLNELGVPPSTKGDRRFLVKRSFVDVLAAIEKRNGIALPSRVDKTPLRRSAIPLLVEQFGFRAFDLAYPDTAQYFKKHWPKTKFQLFCFSNANALAQVGSRMARVKLPEGGFDGLRGLVSREGLVTP